MSACVSEVEWFTGLLHDLQVDVPFPITLYCDNKAAQQIADNPVFHERTKHLKLDCHYVRDKVQEGMIHTSYVPYRTFI